MKTEIASIEDLPIFLGCEQPETCRKCGRRTDFDELPEGRQLHHCLGCGERYVLEFDEVVEG